MALLPKTSSDLKSIDLQVLPPRLLVASLMHLWCPRQSGTVNSSLTLKANRSRLGKAQMMGIGRLPPADQTGL